MLKWTKTEKLVKSGSPRGSNFESQSLYTTLSLASALIPTENQIFMTCLDAHLYEIEYRDLDKDQCVLLSTSELPNCRHSIGDSIRALFELFDRIDKMSSSHAQYQCA
jgi:hypothetical protein